MKVVYESTPPRFIVERQWANGEWEAEYGSHDIYHAKHYVSQMVGVAPQYRFRVIDNGPEEEA